MALFIANNLYPSDKLEPYRNSFIALDVNGDGYLSADEIRDGSIGLILLYLVVSEKILAEER